MPVSANIYGFPPALAGEIADFGSILWSSSATPTTTLAISTPSNSRAGLPINRRPYVSQFVPHPGKAFGMADEQVSAGFQAGGQAVHHAFLGGLVEVDHDIAAENHRKKTVLRERLHQVQSRELDLAAHFRLDPVPPLPAAFAPQEKLAQPGGWNGAESFGGIDGAF